MKTNGELRARICSLELQLDRSKREIEQQREEFLSKGAKATNMLCDADARIAELQRQHGALVEVTRAALDWIDAVPEDTVLPAMPGFDRDWAEQALADLEEAQRRISISEAFAKELSSELITTRKQLEELRAEYSVTLDNLSAAYESVRAQWKLGYAEGSKEVKHWRANHGNVVAKLRLFTQRDDLPVDRLPAYEYVLELEKKLAEAQARIEAARKVTVLGSSFIEREAYNILTGQDTSALDAAIAEAIADEKRNPWKQAIINELVVSYILRADHNTDPRKALAALIDYECKVALDPAVSKEAQELIEPYRKDAERYRWLTNDHDSPDTRKACHDISARIPVMSYSAASQSIDAAIAAKGESE